MHYLISSRINLKKNSFLFFLLLFPLFNISAMTVSYKFDNNRLFLYSISSPPIKARNLLNSMETGHRTEIEFVIRVYNNRRSLLRFMRRRVEGRASVSYVATRDLVNGTFTIAKPGGQRIVKEDEESFFSSFFTATDIEIDMRGAGKGEYYIMSRIEIKTIRLIPPLNLLSGIIPGIITKTDWIKAGTFRIY